MQSDEFQKWKHEAVHQAQALNEQCMREFRLGSYQRWETSLEQGRLYFVDDGIPRVAASILVAGSYSKKSETWLWSWANEHLPAIVKDDMRVVRDWGEKENIAMLAEAKIPADENDGWEFASVALRLLNGICLYRYEYASGWVWAVFKELNFLDVETDGKKKSQDTRVIVTCDHHGSGVGAFICGHLCPEPEQPWFSERPTTKDPWPDSWCSECQKVFEKYGEWTEENSSVLKLKLLCHRCYEEAWSKGEHRLLD